MLILENSWFGKGLPKLVNPTTRELVRFNALAERRLANVLHMWTVTLTPVTVLVCCPVIKVSSLKNRSFSRVNVSEL